MGTDTMRAVRAYLKSARTDTRQAESSQTDVLMHTTGAKRDQRHQKTTRHLRLIKD